MKSTALSELLPQWTKFVVTDLSGRDPLGLARVATNITDHLMPGIVVATDRARYYALYSWILWNIRGTETPTADAAFAEAFQRRESAFAIATLLQDPDSSPVGKRAVARELERADTDIRTGFRILPSNDLGGYGQYYSGSLYNLGLTHRPEGEFDQVTADRGMRLAEAIEKTIRSTKWATESAFRKRRTSLQTLRASAARLGLDAIHESFAEHERVVLSEIFFGFDAEESGVASLRRESLARLLDLVRIYAKNRIPLGATDGATLDDQLVLGPAYFGTLVDADGRAASSYVPPQFLTPCSNMWRQFVLHEIISWTLDSVLSAVLSVLGDAPGGGLPIDKVVERLSGNELVRAIEAYANLEAPTPQTLLANVGVREIPTPESSQKARLKFSLKAKLNEGVLMHSEAANPVEVLGRALPCLALLYAKWRDGSDDSAWREIRTMVGPELAATTVLPRLDSWLSANQGWSTPIRTLVELVVAQHDRIMYEKGRLEACWVHREIERLVHDQDYSAPYPAHNSRQRSAMGILVDLELARKNDNGQYAPTKNGDRCFLRGPDGLETNRVLLINLKDISTGGSLSIKEWFDCRTKLDQMLWQWVTLLRVVHTEWLIALQRVYDHNDIKNAVLPDLEPLKEFAKLFNDVRALVLERMKQFRVQIPNGSHVAPPIGQNNILQPPAFKSWSDEVRTHQLALEAVGL